MDKVKKTYFMRIFNLNIKLIISAVLLPFFGYFLILFNGILAKSKEMNEIDGVVKLSALLQVVSEILKEGGIGLLIVFCLLIFVELYLRIRTDSFMNSFKSTWQTFGIRRFLKQSERSEKTLEAKEVTSFNPIHENFNHAVSKCVVDVRTDKIIVFIKVPRKQQAQKILKDMEKQIKEELSSRNPDYYFSAPERTHSKLWFVGTKRN
jgi:DNA integrity scanning protein DisA with diadenylate cyclase activity